MNIVIDVFDQDQMIAQINKAEIAYENAMKKGRQELRKKVRRKVNRELTAYGLAGTNYANSITYSYVEDGVVVNFPDIWLYLEFGTGLVGEGNPHPDQSFEGAFNGYNNPAESKYSPYDGKFGPRGYFPFPIGSGEFRITSGRPSAPVAYNTWIFAQSRIKPIFEKHLKEAGF